MKKLTSILSNLDGTLSQKRVQAVIAFIVFQCSYIYFFIINSHELKASEFVIVSAVQMPIIYYMTKKIQDEKNEKV